ncbi:coiled-coil alpha-helical rod protein 1-like [Saccostrea echinata]|uniref:coiled-coil alpha-helical rod protein 1-like n=1 Tax=Saccostrea echinata TaxID=191078 RepID=UPI002A81FDAF|nr:coiled-coil alpha-helical rod protein 1-like [Saccostrea echinata]
MASKLNPPSDFAPGKKKEVYADTEKVDLLPPSAFETHTVDAAWKELARATNEVMQLKLENQKLRERKPLPQFIPQYETRFKDDISKDEERKYIDEIIKQSSEISDLKKEIQALKSKQKEELLEMEKQHTYREREHVQRCAELSAEVKVQEERYDTEIGKLSYDHQRQIEELEGIIQGLRDELSLTLSRGKSRSEELEGQLRETHEKLSRRVEELEAELRSKNQTLENQTRQVIQLKNYIGESESVPRPVEIWRKEKETLENRLKICEIDKENCQSNLQLLNIRLNSMKEIMNLQEAELSRANKEKHDKTKQDSLLLTRWREKVYELLVQQKSASIVQKKDDQNWQEKVSDVQNQLTSAKNQIVVLSHSLADKQAQLDIEKNNNKKLQEEVYQAQQMALSLDDRLQENAETVDQLHHFSHSISSKFEGNFGIMQSILGSLKAYGQRISFASSRIEVLQGIYARNEAMKKVKTEDEDMDGTSRGRDDTESVTYVSSELERVMHERDRLAAQLKQDAETWSERLQAATAKCGEENKNLRKTVEDLEQVLQEKTQKCSCLEELSEKVQGELEEAYDNIDHLKTELAKREVGMEQVMSEQKSEIEAEFREQLAEYDRKLSDAKREHTKAVVSLRQLERQVAREKDRTAEQSLMVEKHYSHQLSTLQEQVKSLEKERNLMMATLRQEGLLSKVRSQRSEPIQVQELDVGQQFKKVTTIHDNVPGEERENGNEEPISAVLEDLKVLTTAVMEDDFSGSDSDS